MTDTKVLGDLRISQSLANMSAAGITSAGALLKNMAGTSQVMYPQVLAILRACGPDNISIDYKEDTRKDYFSGDWSEEKQKLLKWNYPLRFDASGASEIDHKSTKDLINGAEATVTENNAKTFAYVKAFIDGCGATWYNDYKVLFQALAYAVAIETRKREIMVGGVYRRINGSKNKVRCGLTAPMNYDLSTLHPLVQRTIPSAMKGIGAITADYLKIAADKNLARSTKLMLKDKFHTILVRKVGDEITKMLLDAEDEERRQRILSKLPAGIIVNWSPLQFPDLPGYLQCLLTSKTDPFFFQSTGTVIGVNFGDGAIASEYSTACQTGAIFMDSTISKLPHRASLKYTLNQPQSSTVVGQNTVFVPYIPVRDGAGKGNGNSGQSVGYNPTGTNCTMEVIQQAQTYLSKALSFSERGKGSTFAQLATAKMAMAASQKVEGWRNGAPVSESANWSDFFLTVTPAERELLPKPKKGEKERMD